ncbi:hypothetical protein M9Y10_023507 [Tritrichomonas musculus]|uniref:Origin recognition complex subunit 2 n=1 Tax=Tritrichomonas musculus TaxID=1915356 RepID=A0ABR2KVE4_9EUKA
MDIDLISDARDYEKYFYMIAEGQKHSKSKTSVDELGGAFDRPAVPVDSLKQFNPEIYEPMYPKWYAILQHFPLLFYGLGSKIKLLNHFSTNYLGQFGYVVEADVFSGQPRIFNSIVTAFCEISEASSLTSFISKLKSQNLKAFIVLFSIENELMNDIEFQRNLIECANSGCIHIIASIDRMPLFPLRFMSGVKFYPIKVETGGFYTQEIGFSSSSKSSATLNSIDRFAGVLSTLTDIANGIFLILLKHQISTGEGLNRNEWTDMSATKLCVKMKGTFPTTIAEFLDHKLISEKKGGDYFTIPLAPVHLKSLLARLDDE